MHAPPCKHNVHHACRVLSLLERLEPCAATAHAPLSCPHARFPMQTQCAPCTRFHACRALSLLERLEPCAATVLIRFKTFLEMGREQEAARQVQEASGCPDFNASLLEASEGHDL
jgi:hypothetical protein